MLRPATHFIRKDEPAWSLSEVNLQSGTGWHRYQIIAVMRGQKPAEYKIDMGPVENFKAEQFCIPGGVNDNGRIEILHTVGELQDIADHFRLGSLAYDRENIVTTDLWARYFAEKEQEKNLLRGRKLYGYGN